MANGCGDFDANTLKIMPNAELISHAQWAFLVFIFPFFPFFFQHETCRSVRGEKLAFPSADHVLSTYLSAPIRSAVEARNKDTSRHFTGNFHLKQAEYLFHT